MHRIIQLTKFGRRHRRLFGGCNGCEIEIAQSFAEAAKHYHENPTALHLRAMNMLYEGLKEKGALVIVPSSAVDTMNLGGLSGMISLAQNNAPKEK